MHITQLIGAPLYFIDKNYYYAWMAMTKQHFALVANTIVQWFSPTVIRVSSDEEIASEFSTTPDGRLHCDFPERMVMMANHQVCGFGGVCSEGRKC